MLASGTSVNKIFFADPAPRVPAPALQPAPQRVRMMVAVGPFSSPDDIEYIGLKAIAQAAQHLRPDTLILMGPFLDMNNKVLQTGNVTNDKEIITFDKFF